MFFQFQNKTTRLHCLEKKIKRSLNVVYCSFRTGLWPKAFLSQGHKNNISDVCDVDSSNKALNFHFLYISVCYVCYVMLCMQTNKMMIEFQNSNVKLGFLCRTMANCLDKYLQDICQVKWWFKNKMFFLLTNFSFT